MKRLLLPLLLIPSLAWADSLYIDLPATPLQLTSAHKEKVESWLAQNTLPQNYRITIKGFAFKENGKINESKRTALERILPFREYLTKEKDIPLQNFSLMPIGKHNGQNGVEISISRL